jgi:hypothetical protein
MNDLIAAEVAEGEFDRFADSMDLELDPATMDEDDLANFKKVRARLVKAIRNGSLTINETGEAVYTPRNPKTKTTDPITFHERTGSSIMAMDGKKKNEDVRKTYAVMAEMCGVHPNIFAGMVGIDGKVCEAIFALLMD